ncbi:tripartite tricarboxylate transporter substrate binding protein [Alcaligenaceae bacterium]|nr:tripartite tricarboxylate transporter substrate binding protein [Alcaligenaceae bacterium]
MTKTAHNPTRRRLLGGAGTLGLMLALPGTASAQADKFPNRPITLIVPFPAGGVTDVQMRALARALGQELGQSVTVLNQPGVGGSLGPAAMARSAAPDGYTIAIGSGTLFRLPLLQKVNFDPAKDFSYIINLTGFTMGIVVRTDSPWKNLDDLLADAKTRPEQINYGSTGVGSSGHVAMERLAKATGTRFNYIPYKGGAEEATALLGGHIDFISNAGWGAQVTAGKMRLLGTYSEQRLKLRPDVPTLKELGHDLVITSPIGIIGPHGMPDAVVAKLHDAFKRVMSDSIYQQALAQYDMEDFYMSSSDYRAYGLDQMKREKVFLEQLGIQLQ